MRVSGGHAPLDGRLGGPGTGTQSSPRPMPVSGPSAARLGGGGGGKWVAPGDIVNHNRPEEACPLCGRDDFPTVTDLEIHCARCTGAP